MHHRQQIQRLTLARLAWIMWLCVGSLLACTPDHLTRKGATSHMILSLKQVQCGKCASTMAIALQRHKGVRKASYDKPKAEVAVWYNPQQVTPADIQAVIKQVGYNCELGAGKGSYPAAVKFPAHLDVKVISKAGEDILLQQHLQRDKVTVFDFYTIWCHPCRLIDKKMKVWLGKRKDLAFRKINIGDWKQPVARRYLSNVPTLPYILVYDRKGQLYKRIVGYRPYTLLEAIEKAAKR